jgi:hypothetical protein
MEELMFIIKEPSGEHALMRAYNVNGCISVVALKGGLNLDVDMEALEVQL